MVSYVKFLTSNAVYEDYSDLFNERSGCLGFEIHRGSGTGRLWRAAAAASGKIPWPEFPGQSTLTESSHGYCTRNHTYGLGYVLQVWVLGPLGLGPNKSA